MAISRMRFKGTTNGTFYIDLAKALSLQERRLHRQKAIYTVYGGFFVDSQGNRIDLNTAPMTWVSKRAVNRGFAMWRKMTAKTLQDAGASSKSKYRDFKVYLNSGMGSGTLSPVDADDQLLYASTPEWDYSTLISDDPEPGIQPGDPTGFELAIAGPHSGSNPNWTRIGLIQSWFSSRPTIDASQPQNIPDVNDPLVNLFDAGDTMDDRLTIINNEGDAPPYDEPLGFGNNSTSGTVATGMNLQRASVAVPASATPVAPIHGFQALCGLIQCVVGTGSTSNEWELVLDVETKGEQF